MLETALGKDRQVEPGNRLDTTRNDFAFERVEFFDGHAGERRKRNCLGYRDYVRPREWAETLETEVFRRRVGARVAATQAAAVGQRMLDPPDAPAFLIEHQVVHHASNRQLRVFLDRIVLQVFVAAIAVDEVWPLGITRADPAAKC